MWPEIKDIARTAQREFMPEDSKAGLIQKFLDSYKGDYVCSLMLYREALGNGLSEPKQQELREIGSIMNDSVTGWEKGAQHRFEIYGQQRSWRRVKAEAYPLIEEQLELPYHILRLCGGDMSFTSAICYDFEVWSAAQKRWLEVSSVSNFESYQANRLHCRFRRNDTKKIEICHTLNGSALALPRIVAAIIENNQTPEGIRVPRVLVPYCGFEMLDDKNF